MTKLPVVTLSISFKGVDFIDSASKVIREDRLIQLSNISGVFYYIYY